MAFARCSGICGAIATKWTANGSGVWRLRHRCRLRGHFGIRFGTFVRRGWMAEADVVPSRCSKPGRRHRADPDHPSAASPRGATRWK